MKKVILAALLIMSIQVPALAAEGIITVQSNFTVNETADRLEQVLDDKGMTIFNRIKHSEAAAKIGIKLNYTELILFGNPKVGSLLMQCQQSVAIDLPQKALIWQDDAARVWISYNNPEYLAKRHNITGCEQAIAKINRALAAIAKSAADEKF